MEQYEWLLLAIGDGMLEPVQVQKLMFVFAQEEKSVPDTEAYEFVPYNWGPCSFEIYDDLEMLIDKELVERLMTVRRWHKYKLTDAGKSRLKQLHKKADKHLMNRLAYWHEWVTSKSFRTLLTEVYREYPEYAIASRFGD